MRIRIESVYDTAYGYKEVLQKYNYEHVALSNEEDLSNFSNYDYADYITIEKIEDILELSKKIGRAVILYSAGISSNYHEEESYLLIYDGYIE